MKKRLAISVLVASLAGGVLATSSASAATLFGDTCVGNRTVEGADATLFQLASPMSPLPSTAPVSGVITKWTLNLTSEPDPIPVIIPQALKVVRADLVAKTAQVVGESQGTVGSGANVFATRIPVQAGDRLGLYGSGISTVRTLYCEQPNPGNNVGAILGSAPLGSTSPFVELPEEARLPVVAAIEPDADGDGYGDETQDACPQSAATQVACPVIKLSSSTTVKKKQVTVILTATAAAKVTVNGTVNLGKGQKAKVKVGPKTVNPGSFTKFKLKFPQKLIDRLQELPPSKALTMKIVSSAPNVAAGPTKKTVRVKLKGQG